MQAFPASFANNLAPGKTLSQAAPKHNSLPSHPRLIERQRLHFIRQSCMDAFDGR